MNINIPKPPKSLIKMTQLKQANPTSTETLLKTGKLNKKQYVKELQIFAKDIIHDKNKFDKFESLVRRYADVASKTGQTQLTNVDYKNFKKQFQNSATGINIALGTSDNDLEFKDYKILNDDLTRPLTSKQFAKRRKNEGLTQTAYVMYWSSRITTHFNYYARKAMDNAKEHGEKYQTVTLDLVNYSAVDEIFKAANLDNMMSMMGHVDITDDGREIQTNLGILEQNMARSNENWFDKPDDTYKKFNKYILNPKYKARYTLYNNRDMMFLDRLYYSLAKSGWSEALDEVKRLIKLGKYQEIIDAYKNNDVEIVFQYDDEQLSDGTGKQDMFVQALKQIQ